MTKLDAVDNFKVQIFADDDIMAASETERIAKEDPFSEDRYTLWTIEAPTGSLTIWDHGNGYSNIVEIRDMSAENEDAFWRRLAQRIADHPDRRVSYFNHAPPATLLTKAAEPLP
ncbi:MAG: hypothetical protein OXC95_08875 [Dehalococcoidia bacterium]|nr:hypothetical protein [Dehalococcoidia bacterium]